MSSSTASPTPLSRVQALLELQSKVGRPTPQICAGIANLRDLCDLGGSGGGGIDWRRGTGGGGGGGPGGRGGGGNSGGVGQTPRPLFRNGSGGSLSSAVGGGAGSPIPRITSQRSFGSVSSVGGGPSTSPGSPNSMSGGAPFTPNPGAPSYSSARYQSMFKNSSQQVEDKILNNIILSKLNKFSGNTYADIRDFLYQILGSGEADLADMIRHFMLLVFKKAASEEVYCALYAKLLAEISSRYKVILEEMQKLQANYLEIFDDVVEIPEGGDEYAVFVEKNKDKRYRQGYSQFLAELAALEILDLSNLEATFRRLFELMLKYSAEQDKKALVEEYADCLVRMSRVLKKRSTTFFSAARKSLRDLSNPPITELIEKKDAYPSLSPKTRFILMDVRDNLSA